MNTPSDLPPYAIDQCSKVLFVCLLSSSFGNSSSEVASLRYIKFSFDAQKQVGEEKDI